MIAMFRSSKFGYRAKAMFERYSLGGDKKNEGCNQDIFIRITMLCPTDDVLCFRMLSGSVT